MLHNIRCHDSVNRPRSHKINRRLAAWKMWGRGMGLLRQVKAEIKEAKDKALSRMSPQAQEWEALVHPADRPKQA